MLACIKIGIIANRFLNSCNKCRRLAYLRLARRIIPGRNISQTSTLAADALRAAPLSLQPPATVAAQDLFGAGEEQSPAFRIFAHDVGVFIFGNAVRDLRPVRSAIFGAIDVRTKIVEPKRIDGRIGRVLIEVACVNDRNLLPGRQCLWRDVGPILPAISGAMNETVVRSCPDKAHVER